MKNKHLTSLVAMLLLSSSCVYSQKNNDPAVELDTLVTKIKADLRAGKMTETALSDDIKQFDVLFAKHKSEKTDVVAQILMMKAQLYLEVFNDPEKAAEVFQQIKRDLPATEIGKRADMILDSLKRPIEAQKIQQSLVEGTKFPDFNEKDLTGKPLSIANYKGKVVLIDFWATWCGPCVAELPNIIQIYQKHHTQGFEIIGVSLDQDQQRLESFIKEKNMIWQQFFDGLGWENKLAMKYGVYKVPTIYLLDREGKIIAKGLHGEELESAVTKALAKN